MRTILVTTGTSLLSNIKKELKVEEPNEAQLGNFLAHADPAKACAETNSLSRMLEDGDRLVFLRSQTKEGKLCAEALARHYRGRGHEAEVVEVKDLTYKESRFKMRGLRSLVSELAGLVREERRKGREVLLNATGGFKAEIAYATLIGLLFRVPVYYIHEAFQEIISLPSVPVGWDYSIISDHEEFFSWMDEELRTTSEVDRKLAWMSRKEREEVGMLLMEEEGYTFISPVGEALYEAYEAELELPGEPVLLSGRARRTYEGLEPPERRRFDRVFLKLGRPPIRRSSSDVLGGVTDCLVFPRGHVDERTFYYEEGGKVFVCEIAKHSDGSYKKLLERGVRREEYGDFRKWQ